MSEATLGGGINPGHLARAGELATQFAAASPFPHVVLDDFLTPGLARGLLGEFPALGAMPRSRDYMFGNKRELSSVAARGPAGRGFVEAVLSPEFATFLAGVSGMPVFVDPDFHGGGFHQGGDGSYLDTHVDFNLHPLHPTWLRTLNLLLYLSPDWQEEWGGCLLVRGDPHEEPLAITPRFNRAVLMLTDERTYHGYRRMSLPPGVTRRSIATYAYRMTNGHRVTARTTVWAPEDAGLAKRLIARHYDGMVRVKNRFLGSATARNR
ncbi:MAG TPA: 2OG-Fe(II) oxygenase [Candidatus Dormibacteraeota bacterium]|nr:2OG-Fe(II) oxygenase [Candidatus Dormibacteraeota bacterium]